MINDNKPGKLFGQLMEAKPSDEDIRELYDDLLYIFESPFDDKINEAIAHRGCVYIEQCQLVAN